MTREKLQTIINLANELMLELPSESPSTAPAGVSGAPTPINIPTPQSSPSKATPAVSGQVLLLADKAMAEALKLKGEGHNVNHVIDQIEKVKKSTRETLNRNAMNAVGTLEDLHNAGVDVSKVREPLHEIEVMSSEDTGVIEGHSDVGLDVNN